MCKAVPPSAGGPGPNYGKPCVPVAGKHNDQPRMSCLFCGKWLDEKDSTQETQ